MTADPWANDDPWAANEPEDTGTADPWSMNPEESAPWDTLEAPAVEDKKETAVTNVVSSEDPITLTFKQGTGFEAPWTVLRAQSVEEAKALLKSAVNDGLFQAVGWAASEFAKTKGGAPAQAAPQQSYQQPAQQAPQQQGQGDGRTCQHGVMNYKTGTNKNGKPYKAYFCPEREQTQQCRAIWL